MSDQPTTEAEAVAALLARETNDTPADDTPDPEEAPVEEVAVPEEDISAEESTDDAEVEDIQASEDEAEEPEAPQEPTLYTVKVDGKEQRVTLEELTRNYSGQASIQRRIQEAETTRREAQALAETFAREVQAVQALAQQAQATGFLPQPKAPDPALAQTNPAAYVKALADYQGKAAAYQQQQAQLQQAHMTARQLDEARHAAHLQEQAQRLAELIPDFANPETAAKTRDRLLKAGEGYGFTADELAGIADARMVAVLHKAAKYDELQARQREAKKPTPTPTPRHVAPSRTPSKPMSEADKARLNHRKNPTVESAVRLLLARGNP